MTTDTSTLAPDVKTLLADARQALEALYGERLLHVILYGSQARGEATEDSDVDVLVVLEGEVRPAQEIDRMTDLMVDLLAKYHHLVTFNPYSESEYQREWDPLMMNVRDEGILVA